MVKDNT